MAVDCGDGSSCEAEETCCPNGHGSYTCCPTPGATCCSDHIHCCPANYPVCDVEKKTCRNERGETASGIIGGFGIDRLEKSWYFHY